MIDFTKKQIFAMIHLAGVDPVKTALKEIEILREEGVHGIIVENYHGSTKDIEETLKNIDKGELIIGINVLPNEYASSFTLADIYNADFIQLDYVAGKYINTNFDYHWYKTLREEYKHIKVFGGVWPKYYNPISESVLEDDLKEAMELCDAIVVTGAGTGKETPLDKIKNFREIIGNFPLVIGAGLNKDNVAEQMNIGNSAIVGSCLKEHGRTSNEINRQLVREFMIELYRDIYADGYAKYISLPLAKLNTHDSELYNNQWCVRTGLAFCHPHPHRYFSFNEFVKKCENDIVFADRFLK